MNRYGVFIIQTNEKKLVEGARQGDFAAFNRLIENYRPRIFGLALKLAKNREDAEDVFQETFLKAIDNIQKFRGESSFGTWLYTICLNVIRNKYGRSTGELLPLEEYLPRVEHGDGQHPELFDWDDPLSKLTKDELKQKIDQSIMQLPLKYRTPFLLRYTEEMSVADVARTTGLTLAAAKSRILRARLAMRQSLNEYFLGERGKKNNVRL